MTDSDRCFIGVMDCGCRVAVVVDSRDAFTRKAVNEFLKSGYSIETTTVAGHRANPIKSCVHGISSAANTQSTQNSGHE